ncbi:MAG: HAD family hydrolase [Actinomycetota bacterium]|nr:HAD family hydrolase [Actinomycetota bacterium]
MGAVTLVLDVDGTLVDTNYHHAVAWFRAFRRHDIVVPVWRLHRAIGMGGDKLVAEVAGDRTETERGDDIRAAWEEEFEPMLAEVCPLEGAHRLLAAAVDRGIAVVLASSGKKDHVEHYLDLLDARELATGWTSSDDVTESKPAPDLIEVALRKAEAGRAVVVGDSVWDCEAARRSGLPSVCLRTGGFAESELLEHGASTVYTDLDTLRQDLADLPTASTDRD